MLKCLFRRNVVFLQLGNMPMPLPPKPGQTISMQNSLKMEAERRRKLDEATRTRYFVVKEESRERKGRVIGIDLGTTNSCVCYIDEKTKKPKIIPSPTGSWVFPTAVTFDKNHQIRLFGEEARACVRTSASATLCSGKRLIGRGFGELGRVQSELHKTNILALNEKGEVAVEIMGRSYTVVHIIAMFLRYLKNEAEKYLNEPVDSVVVSVPAYFTPKQKVATEDSALAAGFDVLEVIDEPSAACLTYTVLNESKYGKSKVPRRRITRSLVFDLGGGTLDCAIMEHDQYKRKFKLVATHGDPLLGGNDWDTVISQYFAEQFQAKWRIPIEEDEGNVGQGVAAHRNLTLEAEKAKIHFTRSTETYRGYNRAFHFSTTLRDIVPLEATLTHEQYVTLTRPLRVRCMKCLDKLFEHTNLHPEDVDNILLVGAMTRDPPVRSMLEDYFGKEVADEDTCPADYAVALGAGIRGGMLQGTFPELTANTRFVSGTVQSLRHGGLIRRLWWKIRSLTSPLNPNAIGQRWRGRSKGLTDEEIADYAKEIVEFEAACSRRLLLERAENEANFIMRRVTADANRKQGMQEKRIAQLGEQLKFWQYMVHNFHDHEDELMRTVRDLQVALDELDGLAGDNTSVTNEGTIDFSKTVGKTVNRILGKPESDGNSPSVDQDNKKSAKPETIDNGALPEETKPSPGPKILRRTAPLPRRSVDAQGLIDAGHPALKNADIQIPEVTRASFLEDQVAERAWREPPVPPGETGSWQDVKEMIDAGEAVGAPLPAEDLQRQMTMKEMLVALKKLAPIDDPSSADHAKLRDVADNLQTMTIVEHDVDMLEIQVALDSEKLTSGVAQQEANKAIKERGVEVSASLYR